MLMVIGTMLAIIGGFMTHYFNRKKTAAEIESLIVQQAMDLVEGLRAEVERLNKRMDNYTEREVQLIKEIEGLRVENKDLRNKIDELQRANKKFKTEMEKFTKNER